MKPEKTKSTAMVDEPARSELRHYVVKRGKKYLSIALKRGEVEWIWSSNQEEALIFRRSNARALSLAGDERLVRIVPRSAWKRAKALGDLKVTATPARERK